MTLLLRAVALSFVAPFPAAAQDQLFRYQPHEQTRWVSPENPTGAKGAGGRENKGAKGHAFETIPKGGSHVLADVRGAGIIDRIWMTIEDRSPEALRGLRLEMYWDGARTPAVSVPLGDFFLHGAGQMVSMETALLASPEGRSFVSYIPMPFRTGARIVVINESPKPVNLIFFDVNYRQLAQQPADTLYFHAWWSRERATKLGRDFRILPRIQGRGRFLGASVTVLTNPVYEKTWWGEGEVKIALDGDQMSQPSLVGTGTEDYIGTAWGQGAFINRYQGAPIATWEDDGRWTFYRWHIPDPIWFHKDIEVALQVIGGARKNIVQGLLAKGAPLLPVTIDPGSRNNFQKLLESGKKLSDPSLPDGHTNYYRSDDVAAVAYFYLDRHEGALPPISGPAERLEALRKVQPK
ncbi:glycoside hydrolase family 172 protein [Sphingomonas sp. LHG3406-1]|uniref:glycoside hydrolase family 172 protein n=1 Tax=Sphingomonas sp. LHG3406-1 TaxID=2804617 RepID=UPI0026136C1B|nr:glycoside hydrolase family 172 protein [Sphingomonas sp. LHG3406-1]